MPAYRVNLGEEDGDGDGKGEVVISSMGTGAETHVIINGHKMNNVKSVRWEAAGRGKTVAHIEFIGVQLDVRAKSDLTKDELRQLLESTEDAIDDAIGEMDS